MIDSSVLDLMPKEALAKIVWTLNTVLKCPCSISLLKSDPVNRFCSCVSDLCYSGWVQYAVPVHSGRGLQITWRTLQAKA